MKYYQKKNKIKKFQNPAGPITDDQNHLYTAYNEGIPLPEVEINWSKEHNQPILDYSKRGYYDMLPRNRTPQIKRWFDYENARKRKAALPIVATALASPALLMGGISAATGGAVAQGAQKALEFGAKAMIPSSYTGLFGTGAYNTVMQGTGASLGGALADAALFGYTGAQAGNRFINNPNFRNGAELGLAALPLLAVPEGFKFIKQIQLRTPKGLQTKNLIQNIKNGKFTTLEDLIQGKPQVDLTKYRGEPLTGNEKGFEIFAHSRTPESDHFANLSHGIENPRQLLSIMNAEFESLPNGARIDLGQTFSGDISSNLLQYAYKNKNRIRMVLPKNLDDMVRSNEHGIRGESSANLFNQQLERLLEHYEYSPNSVPKATYDVNTNTLIMPKLSFIKLHKNGSKIIWN